MTGIDPEEQTRVLAAESLAVGDATGWFERLYAAAGEGNAVVPWDRDEPQILLVEWAERSGLTDGTASGRALVVGAGLGHDAEYLAELGFSTVAFDVSDTAVQLAGQRFPQSTVDYRAADLLDPPDEWRRAFDLVVESLTVQSMPRPYRQRATKQVAAFVSAGGSLLVIASQYDPGTDPGDGPPWPLTRAEVDAFATGGLEAVRVEDIVVPGQPFGHRWRAEFRRPTDR